MKSIGGYFEMELRKCDLSKVPPGELVNSGRHALEYIIRALGNKVKQIWLPYYTCKVVLEQIRQCGIIPQFYHINESLEIADNIELGDNDYIIVNNYFGIKDKYIHKVASTYGNQLIVDNAQAFYCFPILGTNSIYSPRKFFGLPDGGIVSSTAKLDDELPAGNSFNRCSHLLKRIDLGAESGYNDFHSNSSKLNDEPLTNMSNLTKNLLGSIDFEWSKIKRRSNFETLHSALESSNKLSIPNLDSFACPMVYPYMTNDPNLRKRLISNKIYVAQYWPNVLNWCQEDLTEYKLAANIIPLPIDQRYDEEEMQTIISIIDSQ